MSLRSSVAFVFVLSLLVVALLGLGATPRADNTYNYPRLSLGTGVLHEFVEADSIDFLLRFQEVFGATSPRRVNDVKDSMRALGDTAWVNSTVFIHNFMPQCLFVKGIEAEGDGKLPKWIYDAATTNFIYAAAVAAWHNLHDYDVDWFLHDADGDTMCVWGSECNYALANVSAWCPRGAWNGRVTKWSGLQQYSYFFGTTIGKTYVDWLCSVAADSLFLQNDEFVDAYDGIQLEDGADRSLAWWAPYKPGGADSDFPDPKNDGLGISTVSAYMDSTASSFDSLLTHFVFAIRDEGYIARANCHGLRWAYDPSWWEDEDALITHGFQGRKMERYGNWGGWPYDSAGTAWFEIYDGLEDYYHPSGYTDGEMGWDVSVVESLSDADSSQAAREYWTRFNLGQTLMGDGFFAGQAADQDEYFYEYFDGTHEAEYAPLLIDGMGYDLGHAVADYAKFKPRSETDSLYYRQFRIAASGQTPARTTTVVVNMWDDELGGVPARDAQWYKGLRSTFPQPESLLVFNHWRGRSMKQAPPDKPAEAGPSVQGFDSRIDFNLPRAADVLLTIHDIQGRTIRTLIDGRQPAGRHVVRWDGRDDDGKSLASGIYFCRVAAEGRAATQRVVILR